MEHVSLPNEILLGEVAQLLSEGREVVITPKGNSMRPFIRGEVDSVRLQRHGTLRVGDIVLAHFGGRYVMHRIYDIEDGQIMLMGDGNLQGVERGVESDVAGVVVEIITPTGKVKKPSRGWLWRRLLPIRKYLLKMYRKWNKLLGKQY